MAKTRNKIVLFDPQTELYIESLDYSGYYLTDDPEGAQNFYWKWFAEIVCRIVKLRFHNSSMIVKSFMFINDIKMTIKG